MLWRRAITGAGAVLVVASGFGVLAYYRRYSQELSEQLVAQALCQDAVKRTLGSPAAVDFGSEYETQARRVEGRPGKWSLNGRVTSVNKFNAPLTALWACDADTVSRTASASLLP